MPHPDNPARQTSHVRLTDSPNPITSDHAANHTADHTANHTANHTGAHNPKSAAHNPRSGARSGARSDATARIISAELGDIADMAARFARAAHTLHALPRCAHTAPAGGRSTWPDFIQKTHFSYSQTRDPARPNPPSAAIDDLDHLAGLLWHLDAHQRQLVWARACNIGWAALVARMHRSRTSLNRDHKLALALLCRHEARLHGSNRSQGSQAKKHTQETSA